MDENEIEEILDDLEELVEEGNSEAEELLDDIMEAQDEGDEEDLKELLEEAEDLLENS